MDSDGSWQLPGYQIGRVLGRGGFATVFEARQLSLNRSVAIKVLTTDISSEADRRRFDRERESLSRLSSHPYVVDVYDAGVSAGRPYIVMRLYERGSLAQLVTEHGPLEIPEVASVVGKLAQALDAAHGLGIVHRDIKPDNVLLTDSGEPVLADFGIAALVDPDGTNTLTHASTNFFTMAHVAPEVLERQLYSPASDIYALASTVYVLLAGHPAFDPRNNPRVVSMILDSPVPPINRPGLSATAGAVLVRAMAKNPGERFASAGAFASTFTASVTVPIPSAVISPMAPPPAPTHHLPEAEQPTVLALPPQGPSPFAGPRPVPPPAAPSAGPYRPAAGPAPGPYGVPMPAGGPPGAASRSRGGWVPVLAAVGGAIAVLVLAGVLMSRLPDNTDPTSSAGGGTVVTVTSAPTTPAASGWTTTTSPDTTSPDTTSSLSAADQDLVDNLPSSLVRRDSCTPFSQDSSTAGVVCAAALGQEGRNTPRSVIALQFDTRADLDASYQRQTKEAVCPGGSGQWNFSSRPNVTIGNVSCYQNSDMKAVVAWTYWDRKLACFAIGRGASVADLHGWWKSADAPTA